MRGITITYKYSGPEDAWREALEYCLGPEALDLDALARTKQQSLGGNLPPLGLGDFFLPPDDPMNPDQE